METQKLNIIPAQSNINWVGRKVTGAHDGTIDLKEGALFFNDDQFTGGEFVIDVKSLKILDITDTATNQQFAGHLHSDDFFSTEQHPEARLITTQVAKKDGNIYHVEGKLSIKNITEPVSFDAVIEKDGNKATASGKIVIDRTKYGIKFRSGNFFKDLGDTLIHNDFELNVLLTAQAATATA